MYTAFSFAPTSIGLLWSRGLLIFCEYDSDNGDSSDSDDDSYYGTGEDDWGWSEDNEGYDD